MTIGTRWVPGGRQRAQRPCFLFGAKEAGAGEESGGIRQRFPYWCNKTKTSRTAGRRSLWSPRSRHHQSLWQAKTTFVMIACTSCPLQIGRCGIPSRLIFGKRTRASINRTSHHHRKHLILDRSHSILSLKQVHLAQEHLSSGGCSSLVNVHPQPERQSTTPHWSRVLHHNVAQTSINLVSHVLWVRQARP